MGKLAIGLAGALMLVSVAFTAQAQTQGAGSIQTQAQNATIIHKTVRRFRPLVPAWHAPRLRPRPLLVRALLVSG